MTLSNGSKLSHYEITSQIGKGGMGEVYQAKDLKLGREVAIKVLPEEFARDADRVARFQREAKLLASLNHPNIAAIYGLEESDGTNFLVMELVEGNTLDERIKSGTIPVEEALKLAFQIAEALEAAHEKGVIHRDLKPANIKVTPEGKVKVLDFGLAKAYAGDQENLNLSNSPTLSDAATRQGVILGTAAYMSPEQARGKPVDKRADIWAFGVVLYEMLSGKAAFLGKDITDTLAAVIRSEPEWGSLPANLHWRLKELLERCLEKEARDRYGSISDARVDIQKILADPGGPLSQKIHTVKTRKKVRLKLPWVAAIAILCLLIAGFAAWKLKPAEPRSILRFDFSLPDDRQYTTIGLMPLAVSPDGSQFAFSTTGGIYLRSADEWTARLIVGTEESPLQPFFSPDGKWIGYYSTTDQKLKKISVSGGAPSALCESTVTTGVRWYPDNSILFSTLDGIKRVSANGGTPETLVEKESLPESPFFPQLLPDGRHLLFTIGGELQPIGSQKVVVQSLESGEQKELFTGKAAQYLSTGHLIYRLGNSLFAVPFDLSKLEEVGGPISVIEDVLECTVSESGMLVYIPGKTAATGVQALRTLVWADRSGNEDPLEFVPDAYAFPRISPDGNKVALAIGGPLNTNIWVLDLARRTRTRLTFDETADLFPLWTLDGKRVVYFSFREGEAGIYWKAADGTGEPELLASVSERILMPASWSADGKTLALMDFSSDMLVSTVVPIIARAITAPVASIAQAPGAKLDIALLPVEGDRELKSLLADKYIKNYPQISPDGKWIAYVSDESVQDDVYVCPYPNVNGGKWTISTSGGTTPKWSSDGRELFYISGDWMMSVAIEPGTAFTAGEPQNLFKENYYNFWGGQWDIHSNGKQFLMIKPTAQTDGALPAAYLNKANIVLNWFEELKEKVPVD